jgi:hypothetical protein
MRSSKYPLEPLARLKKERAEGAVRDLGRAVSAREEASHRRAEVEEARKEAEARAARVRQEERAVLEKGGLRAADLMRAEAWEARVKAEDVERARAVEEARASLATKTRLEVEAQANVARVRGEANAVSRHEARWHEAQRRARDLEEEEAAAEAQRPKPPR